MIESTPNLEVTHEKKNKEVKVSGNKFMTIAQELATNNKLFEMDIKNLPRGLIFNVGKEDGN
jgi:hypothetical protein